MVGVALPCRKQGKSGTRPSIFSQGATYRIGVGDGSYSLVVARSMGPVAGNFNSSKVLKNTRLASMSSGPHYDGTRPGGIFWGPPGPSVARAQKALQGQLRARMPHALQGHIRWIFQAERVGWENQTTILAQHCWPGISQDIPGYPRIYVHNPG